MLLVVLGLYQKSNGTKGIGYYGGTAHPSIGGVSTEVKRFGHQGLLNATSFTGMYGKNQVTGLIAVR